MRALLCNLKYVTKLSSKLVDELCKKTNQVLVILMAKIGERSLSNQMVRITFD